MAPEAAALLFLRFSLPNSNRALWNSLPVRSIDAPCSAFQNVREYTAIPPGGHGHDTRCESRGLWMEMTQSSPSQARKMTGEQRMLAASRLQAVDATPVWFMRQAGRCLAEYRQLRERYDILTLAKTPEICAQITKMPVDIFGVDA